MMRAAMLRDIKPLLQVAYVHWEGSDHCAPMKPIVGVAASAASAELATSQTQPLSAAAPEFISQKQGTLLDGGKYSPLKPTAEPFTPRSKRVSAPLFTQPTSAFQTSTNINHTRTERPAVMRTSCASSHTTCKKGSSMALMSFVGLTRPRISKQAALRFMSCQIFVVFCRGTCGYSTSNHESSGHSFIPQSQSPQYKALHVPGQAQYLPHPASPQCAGSDRCQWV